MSAERRRRSCHRTNRCCVADCEETRNRTSFRVKNLTVRIDERTAEGSCHTALERNGIEGSPKDRTRILVSVGRCQFAELAGFQSGIVFVDNFLQLNRISPASLAKPSIVSAL